MIPLNDTEPNRYTSWPFMVMAIIIVNIFVATYEEVIFANNFFGYYVHLNSFGSVPTFILGQRGGGALSSITHMFLHGGLLHLGGNMLALWVYGRRVEDVCGPWRFLIFYLICGVFADIVSTATRFNSDIPGIGASGAIAGIMGAYLILFPKGRIRTMLFLWIVPTFPTIRAYWLILYFFVLQIPPALDSLMNQTDYNVNYWAHLGGFFASVTIFFFLSPKPFDNYRHELPL
jgi:membrane associated rhomboid family serine protease